MKPRKYWLCVTLELSRLSDKPIGQISSYRITVQNNKKQDICEVILVATDNNRYDENSTQHDVLDKNLVISTYDVKSA